MKKRGEEPRAPVASGLSHTEAFVKKTADLLKQELTSETHEATLQTILELCKDSYDLNRAGAAAMVVAENQPNKSETFNLYCKIAGDLYRMQCESERNSGRTTLFTGFYDSAMDAYLDCGYIKEAVAVTFEHSHWLMRNALYRDEAGKQKYLRLSVNAFDEVMRRSEGELATFVYEQRDGREKAADALRDMQPPAHLTNIKDPGQLRASVRIYRELIEFLEQVCKACDIAAYLSRELAAVLEKILPELAGEHTTLAEGLQQRHIALLEKHGITHELNPDQEAVLGASGTAR